jgi:hypothetical protein
LPLRTVRDAARVLGIGIELLPRSRDAALDRLVNARHSALGEAVIAWIESFDGWVTRPEVSFSIYGERGVVDLLAWHAATRVLLLIELKTDVVDVGELLATFGRKARLGPQVAATLGFRPDRIGAVVIVAGSMANRRRVAAHRSTFQAALPDRVVAVRGWLRWPTIAAPAALRALMYFSNSHHGHVGDGFASRRRVTRPRRGSADRAAERGAPGRRAVGDVVPRVRDPTAPG